MRKLSILLSIALFVILIGTTLSPVLADPKYMGEGDGIGVWTPGSGNSVFIQLTDKDGWWGTNTWNPIEQLYYPNNGLYGWIHYEYDSEIDGVFSGSIGLRTLTPNTWYLVTFWSPMAASGGLLQSSAGLFGGKTDGSIGWVDVALVKTDEDQETAKRHSLLYKHVFSVP